MSRISVDVSSARIPVLQVGYQGENEVTDVLFDISSWITEFGEGVAQLRVKRPGNSEEESYVLSLTITDGIAVWTVSETDTFNKGNGKVQLSYMVGNILKKAVIYPYKVGKSIVGADNPVDPFDSWIERSKAWAIGETLDGNAVPETDETYQNNAKHYAEQTHILGSAQVVLATEQATLATEKATLATEKADAAAASESNAAASEAAVNGVSTQLTTRMSAIETEQSVQSARMDTFTSLPEGSTSGNAELADIRVGANGTTYDTAGNAVRGQIGELKSDLSDLDDLRYRKILSDNLFDGRFDESGYISSSGDLESESFKRTSRYYEIEDGTNRKIYFATSTEVRPFAIILYDGDKNYITDVTNNGQAISNSAKYFRVHTRTEFSGDAYISTIPYTEPINYGYEERVEFKESTLLRAKIIAENNQKLFTLYSQKNINGFIDSNGRITNHSSYFVTEPIFMASGEQCEYKLRHGATLPIIAFYENKEDSTSIDTVIGSKSEIIGTYTALSDGYIRFCYYYDFTDGYVRFTNAIADNIKHYLKNNVSLNGVPSMNILCFGDSIIGNEGYIAEYLADLSGANVINGAIGGTSVSIRNGTSDKYRFFDGEKIIKAFIDNDYTEQDLVVEQMSNSVKTRLSIIKNVDKTSLDMIILAYGTNDYTQGKTIAEIETALGNCIDYIQGALPTVKILVLTPTWRIFSLTENGDNKIYNVSTLKEIANAIDNYCKDKRISVLNSYQNMPLSYNTIPTYMIKTATDADNQTAIEVPNGSGNYYSGVHFNKFGSMVYAHLINGKINSIY